MTFKLALAQMRFGETNNPSAMAKIAADWIARAADAGAQLLVFPEALMMRYPEGDHQLWLDAGEEIDGNFARILQDCAAEHNIAVVFTMLERSDSLPERCDPLSKWGDALPECGDALPYNTAVVCNSAGCQLGAYRKAHLFDAQGFKESDRFSAGCELFAPVDICPLRPDYSPLMMGLGICYDLRFPEVATSAALAGAQLMVYPASWVSGPNKVMQWETLLRARAIENGMFVAGVSNCDEGIEGKPGRIGESRVFGPDGTLVAAGGSSEELVLAEIDLSKIAAVRSNTPSLKHRRPDLYQGCSAVYR